MTRAQGQEYLLSALRPLVPSDSLEMVIEYISSYNLTTPSSSSSSSSCHHEIIQFLEDVCGKRNNLNEIIEKYIQLCQQLDQKSAIFVPKQQYYEPNNHGVKKVSSTPPLHQQQQQLQQTQQQQQQRPQSRQQQQQQSNPNHLKKKNQFPNQSEPLTFVTDKKTQESSNPKLNQKSKLENRPPNRNGKPKKTNPSEKQSELQRQICGCFATHHDYCTSCMSCGRIHCSIEGFGTCIFCGSDLFPPLSADIVCDSLGYPENNEIILGAYLQKDKLLQFDKEHAKRTQVHDAQVCPLCFY